METIAHTIDYWDRRCSRKAAYIGMIMNAQHDDIDQ